MNDVTVWPGSSTSPPSDPRRDTVWYGASANGLAANRVLRVCRRSDFIYTKNSARPRSDFLYTITHVGGKPSPPCRNGAPSTLSASLWSGLCYLINLIEERPFLLFLKNAIWVFFLGVNVFPSTKCCISHSIFFHVFYASRSFLSSFFLVSVFPTGCVRVNSSVGDGLGGFRLLLTYGCSLYNMISLIFGR